MLDIMRALLSEEVNEAITLVINIATIILAAKFRKAFKNMYPGVGKFYDTLLLATVVWFVAECFYAPSYFSDYFSEEFIAKSEWIADNIWIVFQLLFLYAFASLFGALISKYRVEVVKEIPKTNNGGPILSLSPGAYIVLPGKAKEVFLNLLQGRSGLVISRIPPDKLKENFGLKKTPVLWITKVEGKNCVYPTRLEYLGHLIIEFLRRDEIPKVILIDCVEYLVVENSFHQVFKFLLSLKDHALLTNSIILLVTSSETWESHEWALLTREFLLIE